MPDHERAPLLARSESAIAFARFSTSKKRLILATVSLAGLVNRSLPRLWCVYPTYYSEQSSLQGRSSLRYLKWWRT
jgi:hypothetical protein